MPALILALIAIGCEIAGFIPAIQQVQVLSMILSFATLGCAIAAWVVGKKLLRDDPDDGKAKAGKIIGMILTILAIIGVALIIVAVIGLAGFVGGVLVGS